MQSAKRHRTRASTRGTSASKSPGEIRRYFLQLQGSSPGTTVTAPRGSPRGEKQKAPRQSEACSSPTPQPTQEYPTDTYKDTHQPTMESPQPPDPALFEQDIRGLLQALPTRSDIEALILRLEETHRRDIQEVRGEVSTLTERVTSGEASVTSLTDRVAALEQVRDQQRDAAITLQLHLEDMEDRSRRNNLRLRGIPETTSQDSLGDTVREIFRTVLGEPTLEIELDRVHRALGPRSDDPTRPRDVVCRLHRYTIKENILRRAWEHGDVELEGTRTKILPDLSRATLKRRALLRPLLDLAKQKGLTYRWGYPLSVLFRGATGSFSLQRSDDLPALFRFMEAEPVQVPDWLQFLPRPSGRSGLLRPLETLPPRQHRNRRRNRSASGGEPRE